MEDAKYLKAAERLAKLDSFLDDLYDLAIQIEDDDILWITPENIQEECMQAALRAIVDKVFESNV